MKAMKARMKRLSEHLDFTPTERAVLLTLVGAFLLGLGIRLLGSDPAGVPPAGNARLDAEFAARSSGGGTLRFAAGPPGAPGGAATAHDADTAGAKIDLNRATKRDLMGLPGIGGVIAGRILLYREERGRFERVEDLLRVRGIGKKKLERIAPYCTVEE